MLCVFFSLPFESQIFHSCTEFLWLHRYLLCLDRLRMSFHWWVGGCFVLVCVFSFFPSFITVLSTPESPSKSKTALLFIEKHKYLWCSIHQHKCITWPQSVLVTEVSRRCQNKWRTGTIQHGVKAVRLPLQTWCVLWERAVVFACIFFPYREDYTFCSLKEKVFAIKVKSKKTNQPTKTHTQKGKGKKTPRC